jgi:phosphoinositide-3-kinase regulatory subunit 4
MGSGWCRDSNDFLLPAMITFLNDRDWQLRGSFFRHIPAMAAAAGPSGLEAFLMPCLEQVQSLN